MLFTGLGSVRMVKNCDLASQRFGISDIFIESSDCFQVQGL